MRLNVDYMDLDDLLAQLQDRLPSGEKLTRIDVKHFQSIFFLLAEMNNGGWISVKDRLPNKDGRYLIVWKGAFSSYIDIAYFLENLCDNPQFKYEGEPEVPGFYKGDGEGDWIVTDVTYWMPLPELPDEEKDVMLQC